MKYLILGAFLGAVAWFAVAVAQEMPAAAQRALIISSMAQQLAQAEIKTQALEGQLAQANKQIDDIKANVDALTKELQAKCGDACKDAPAK